MSYAKITRQWPDSSVTVVEVGADSEHPDMLDQLVRRVATLDQVAAPDVDDE